MSGLPISYVVVDVETTGLSPARGERVVELGAVRVVRGAVVGTFSQLINPGVPIHPSAQAVHGISPAALLDAPRMEAILPSFITFTAGLPLVAHNAAFDSAFLEAECFHCSLACPFDEYVCTLLLARLVHPDLLRHNLDALLAYYGIAIFNRHRALGDVSATQLLYERLRTRFELSRTKNRPLESRSVGVDATPGHVGGY